MPCGAVAAEAPAADHAWIWGWVIGLAVFFLIDLVLVRMRRRTMSKGTQDVGAGRPWVQVLVAGLVAVLGWHLVWGFPWTWRWPGRVWSWLRGSR